VPDVSVPKAPSLPKAPSVNTPSVQVPSTKDLPKVPSVNVPSVGGSGGRSGSGAGGGAATGQGAGGSAGSAGSAASGASGSTRANGSTGAKAASRARAHQRRLTPRQRAAHHERKLRQAARELEGCLPALASFDRQVIVLRGGLHGRRPLSRAGTASRLHVPAGRVRSAESRGLAGLRKADSEQGCGMRSSAGRRAAAQRLAQGSAPALAPLAVVAPSPALVSTGALQHGKHRELAAHASSSSSSTASKADREPRRAGFVPTSGDQGSGVAPGVWLAILVALALAGAGFLLLRRRTANSYDDYYSQTPYTPAWSQTNWNTPPQELQDQPAADPHDELDAIHRGPVAGAPPVEPRRRDRAMQAFGGLAASGALASLLVGRLLGRRRRR
jgi:hypothetical protein